VRQPQAGAIQLVEVRPKLRSSVRLVASVAWWLVTSGFDAVDGSSTGTQVP
jgi:hypothetical protein